MAFEPVALNDTERELYELAVEEMGGSQYCYLKLDDDAQFSGGATSHHALLLREERHLHESLFKRPDGISVLFATSTLAQGMNLPSEIVIIAGDSRFDPEADKLALLEAHELLNAAGRAGRAGERSQGFVLVIPSRVIPFDEDTGKIGVHWATLKNIFEQSDQCLTIDEPMTALLDSIHLGIVNHGMPAYLLSKLPISTGEDPHDASKALLSRTFAAFRANRQGRQDWVESRIAAAVAAQEVLDNGEPAQWIDLVSGSTGVSVQNLQGIQELLESGALDGDAFPTIDALLNWIGEMPERLLDLMRPENLEVLLGEPYKKLETDREKGDFALPKIRRLLPLWMAGKPLCEIERDFLGKVDVGLCKHARHFSLRVVPDLAFIAGLPARIFLTRAKAEQAEGEELSEPPLVLATLQSIIREGCDSPEALAARINLGRSYSRVAARTLYNKYIPYIPPRQPEENFELTRQRLEEASVTFLFAADD